MDNFSDRISALGDAGFPELVSAPAFVTPCTPSVLVAAHDDASGQCLTAALTEAGYTAWRVASGTAALASLKEANSSVILVADENLPEFGGFLLADLLALASDAANRFSAIVLTDSLQKALHRLGNGERNGFPLEVLVRPFHVSELLLAVGLAADRLVRDYTQNARRGRTM